MKLQTTLPKYSHPEHVQVWISNLCKKRLHKHKQILHQHELHQYMYHTTGGSVS
jgi:hypothetical protein